VSRILVVDDDSSLTRSFFSVLGSMGQEVVSAGTGTEALEIIKKGEISLTFLDLRLPDMNGIRVLKEIKNIDESILVIIITGYATVESAVEAMRYGAYDYMKKPFKADAVKLITKLALEKITLSRQVESFYAQEIKRFGEHEMIGNCAKMVDVSRQIGKVAPTDTNVLVQGESGTGKELVAKLVHKMSNRSSGPIIHVNCSAFPENLLESEFFGYEKGSFTGAHSRHRGLFDQANGGTLHFDEVGDMPLALQAKLLRVLEEKKFRRIGGVGEIGFDVRFVASTNKSLLEEIEKRRFRSDLYYRLSTFLITVPPLREREGDIMLLVNHWISKNNVKFAKKVKRVSKGAQELFLRYPWPGNVRELKNVVERAILLLPSQVTVLSPEHIPLQHSAETCYDARKDLQDTPLLRQFQLDEGLDYYQVTENITNNIKKRIIQRALQLSGGNKTKASRILHVSRAALWREMRKIGLQDDRETED
jgi:two-component system response regulator AtoC